MNSISNFNLRTKESFPAHFKFSAAVSANLAETVGPLISGFNKAVLTSFLQVLMPAYPPYVSSTFFFLEGNPFFPLLCTKRFLSRNLFSVAGQSVPPIFFFLSFGILLSCIIFLKK